MRLSALAFLLGVLWVQQQPALPNLAWLWWATPLVALAWRWPRYVLPVLFLLGGAGWSTYRAELRLQDSLSAALEGQDLRVRGRIADLPAPGEHGPRFVFDVDEARQQSRVVQTPRRLALSIYDQSPELRVGDQWDFTVRLRRPHGFQNPGGFDSEKHLFQLGIRATGYVREHEPAIRLIALENDIDVPWWSGYRIDRFRQQLGERFAALMPGERFAPMITAFANGDGGGIPDDQWNVLSRTGTTHLIAISGMNIGLVSGIVFVLVRWLWSLPAITVLWWPAPRVAAVAALTAATAYAALAGFAIPTQRALVMLIVVLGGVLSGRRSAPSYLLALALLTVLLLDPFAVMAPGFWLSFGAVALILYVAVGASMADWKQRVIAWGRVQWAVTIGLFPLLLFLFQQASLSGPLANAVAIPVIESVVIPATLTAVVASLFLPDSLTAWPLWIAIHALDGLWPALTWLANLSGGLWIQPAPPVWSVVVAALGTMILLAPRGFPARWLGVLWLLPALTWRAPQPFEGELWFTLLDVGQGLAAVVRTREHTLVYDAGARFNSRFDAGRAVLVPYLRNIGVTRVDKLVVSHGDNDHIGGSQSLVSNLPVREILSSVPERLPNAQSCVDGQNWVWDGVEFTILHPNGDARLKGNNRCCVLRVASSWGTVLLPGDIAAKAERRLIRDHLPMLRSDILIAPHHGSKSSSTVEFVQSVQPHAVLFPVGYRNRYHHPNAEVVARYRQLDAELADSSSAGAITIRMDAAGLYLERYRETHRRYWQGR